MPGTFFINITVSILTRFIRLSQIDKPLNQIALNWVLQKESVVSALVGCRNAEQVVANGGATDWKLSEEEMGLIDDIQCEL